MFIRCEEFKPFVINCPFIQQIWFISTLNFRLDDFSNMTVKTWLALILDKKCNLFSYLLLREEIIVFTDALFDLIWFNRNKVIHGSSSLYIQDIMLKASKSAKDHWNIIYTLFSTNVWCLPNHTYNAPPGWLKENTNSSFIDGKSHFSCIICIIRNNSGSIVLANTTSHLSFDALTAEDLSILEANRIIHNGKSRMLSLKTIHIVD